MDEITNEPSKKEAAKEERRRRKELLAGASAAAVSAIAIDQPDSRSSNYGDVELNDLQSKSITGRKWTEVGSNIPELKDQAILIRGRVHTIRPVIKKMAFVVVRERGFTAQCVLNVKPEFDTRLNFRILDIRTPANQGIFRIQCQVENIFRQFLLSEGFVGIHTPKLIGGSSEGGSAVFRLDYKGQPACLAQSPQLHKQMAVCGDFGRVFEIGPVFRAEDSFTHRHLCEFTGLDAEMEIKEHYSEVMDIVDRLFVAMFDSLNEKCKKELEAIGGNTLLNL
ncbi:Aspartate--tRNA ligase, cytoplasmic [Capsicum annuum]|nr:Aspartate--tRNA ligase, cytoplasmic [Capsicum annuum]